MLHIATDNSGEEEIACAMCCKTQLACAGCNRCLPTHDCGTGIGWSGLYISMVLLRCRKAWWLWPEEFIADPVQQASMELLLQVALIGLRKSVEGKV